MYTLREEERWEVRNCRAMSKKSEVSKMEMERRSGRKKTKESELHPVLNKGVRKGKWVRKPRVANKKSGEADMAVDSHTSSIRDNIECEEYAGGEVRESCGACEGNLEMVSEGGSESSVYWDEEEVFNMPALINSMAEGLIIPPPALQAGFNWLPPETTLDFTLWAD